MKTIATLAICAVLGVGTAQAQSIYEPYSFTTLAGSAGSTGNADGTGSAARFNLPWGIAVDTTGNIYVTDQNNNAIRRITPSGIVSTLAGGTFGSADGTGSAATFSNLGEIALDSSGNAYVADASNHTIRKCTPAGVVTTLAGFAGAEGSADGTGSSARFSFPLGMAVDSADNVYVGEYGNYTIRKITPAGVVSTLAGLAGSFGSADGTGSTARFMSPHGLAVDGMGNIYVADAQNGASGNNTIRKVTPDGVVTTVAGLAGASGSADGSADVARFLVPFDVAVDGSGNLYVADEGNHSIRKITPAGVVTTLAGLGGVQGSADGAGSDARFYFPFGIAVDSSGKVYVTDAGNDTIRRGIATVVPPGDTTPPTIICPANLSVGCGVERLAIVSYPAPTASDDSGVPPTVTCVPASGTANFAVGVNTVVCTAVDATGNSSQCSFTVTRAALGFTGFLPPIGGEVANGTGGSFADPVRAFKLGSTIPVKFQASCGGSPVATGEHTLQATKYSNATDSDPGIDATPTDAATTGNQFRLTDTATGAWHFNLNTKFLSVGTWKLTATLSDGSVHEVWISIKK